jgi:hypothetical protein
MEEEEGRERGRRRGREERGGMGKREQRERKKENLICISISNYLDIIFNRK